jgi:cobyric acid synthase
VAGDQASGADVLGICSGFQMLGDGSTIPSVGASVVEGLGWLPVRTAADKIVRRVGVTGYGSTRSRRGRC